MYNKVRSTSNLVEANDHICICLQCSLQPTLLLAQIFGIINIKCHYMKREYFSTVKFHILYRNFVRVIIISPICLYIFTSVTSTNVLKIEEYISNTFAFRSMTILSCSFISLSHYILTSSLAEKMIQKLSNALEKCPNKTSILTKIQFWEAIEIQFITIKGMLTMSLILLLSIFILKEEFLKLSITTIADIVCSVYLKILFIYYFNIFIIALLITYVIYRRIIWKLLSVKQIIQDWAHSGRKVMTMNLNQIYLGITAILKATEKFASLIIFYIAAIVISIQAIVIYNLFSESKNEQLNFILKTFLSFVLFFVFLVMFSWSKVTTEVRKSYSQIYLLYYTAKNLEEEIMVFSILQQMGRTKFGISFFGLFVLSKGTVLKVLGATTTQLLVIMQLVE